MSEQKLSYIGCATVILIVCGLSFYSYYHEKSRSELEKQQSEIMEKEKADINNAIDAKINDFARKHNAVMNWDQDQRYTLQLQNDLVVINQPIFFTGSIEDIFRIDENYFIRFSADELSSYLYVELKCDEDKTNTMFALEKNNTDKYSQNKYAIIAKFDSIRKKSTLDISGNIIDDEDIDLSYDPVNIFLATGSCIDIMQMEEKKY